MAAAFAIDFTLFVKDSMTKGPLNPMSRQAFATSSQGTCPDPGAPRSFSHECRCRIRLPAARIASPIDRSSMFMWNVSSMTPHAG